MTKEKLGALILDSERQMYATAKSILPNDEDCADAIQETIVKAFSGMRNLKRDSYAKTWLMRILINECHNIYRKQSRLVSLEDYPEKEEVYAPEEKDYEDLYEAIWHLNEDLRIAVTLYYVEELSIREIAAILDVSEGAVQKRLARARAKLKTKLQTLEEGIV